MKQSIKLDGLGLATFDDAIRAAGEVCKHFDRVFEAGQLEHWAAQHSPNENPVLDVANRVFIAIEDLGATELRVPIDHLLDPYNIGSSAESNGYRHTEDNAVEYTELKRNDKGDLR
ncbi:hypothetical protein C0991_006348, partial [Blastosporella zonata]